MEDNKDDRSNHPASFSTVATTGLWLASVSIFLATSSIVLGNLRTKINKYDSLLFQNHKNENQVSKQTKASRKSMQKGLREISKGMLPGWITKR